MAQHQVNVRYTVDDVKASIDWYTQTLGFKLLTSAAPAFADVERVGLRLLLSGEKSLAGRPMPTVRNPGWAAGTASSWWSRTCVPRSSACAPRA